jgi:murein DD-endopeptidase MepM/ murein hydrolase activator NlpD
MSSPRYKSVKSYGRPHTPVSCLLTLGPYPIAGMLDAMDLFRFSLSLKHVSFAFCVAATVFVTAAAHSQSFPMTLTPAQVIAGSPELIRVEAPATATIDGDWLGRPLQFFPGRSGHTWFALAGVDVEAATGPSTLRVAVHAGTVTHDLTRSVDIQPAHYRTGSLTVSPRFVEPDLEAQKQIEAESKLKAKIFAISASDPLWSGSFRAPVMARPTDSFGTRRMFNGKLASIHKGMDFRAASGTPVRAANRGVVVLARPLYYEGNCVIIDHGLGLYTLSMHFSRIDVHEGQHIAKGERLGLSGATGRVTGPHMHWAVRWQNAYLDPAKLLHLDLSAVH